MPSPCWNPAWSSPAGRRRCTAYRPWRSRADLLSAARRLMAAWGEAELTEALSAHPRIGEKPAGSQAHAALSRQEQGSVDDRDAALAQALKEGNARYEARFGTGSF